MDTKEDDVILVDDAYFFTCPHCKHQAIVLKSDVNCKIFRHAVFKKNNQSIPPHSKKEECEKYISEGLVYGCAKPIEFIGIAPNFKVKKCEYK